MSRLFKREVAVSIGPPKAGTITVVRDLRVTFEIEKHLGAEPNTCNARIYNLAESTRAAFQKRPLSVRIDAGYDGELGRLFTGDLRWAASALAGDHGVDWETALQVGDGDRAHRFSRCGRSFVPGTKALVAVNDVVKSMGLKLPDSVTTKLGSQFATGVSVFGNSGRELTRLLKPYGLTWSVQDGRLQVLADGDVRTDAPIDISQDTGMIGSPEFGAPIEASSGPTGREHKGHPPILKVRTLLFPGLTPGGLIHLKSRAINGVFRLERVLHTGDTHGSDWYSDLEAKQVR